MSLTAACTSTPQENNNDGGPTGSVSMWLLSKPDVFSPMATLTSAGSTVMDLIWGALIKFDSNLQLVPGIAKEMPTVSPDGTTFTFKLREGITWNDGTPFTSKDVLFTLNLLANPKSGSTRTGDYTLVEGFDAVKAGTASTLSGFSAPDANTFVVKTVQPHVALLTVLPNAYILPEHVLKDVALDKLADNAFFKEPKVGIGPYDFVRNLPDQYVELKANTNAYKKVKVDRLFLKPVATDAATAQITAGELDVATVNPTDVSVLENNPNLKVLSQQTPSVNNIMFNLDKPYLKDARIRQAVLYALDRKKIVSTIASGRGTVWSSNFLQKELADVGPAYDYDPAKAKALLAEAGWDSNRSLVFVHNPGTRELDTLVTVLQSQLAEVGIKMEIKQTSSADRIKALQDRSFDATLLTGGNFASDPWQVYPYAGCDVFYPASGSNIAHYCNPAFDTLMKAANGTGDQAARIAIYKKAAEIMNKDLFLMPIYIPQTIWAVTTRLEGFQPSGSGGRGAFANGIENWSVKS